MVNPVKYNWNLVKLSAVLGTGLAVFMFVTLSSLGEVFNIWRILGMVGLVLTFTLMGFCFAITGSSIFNRKVDHPADPSNLIPDQLYWLNGQTHAIYKGQDNYTGQYLFSIYGIDTTEDQTYLTRLYPGLVRAYISDRQEI